MSGGLFFTCRRGKEIRLKNSSTGEGAPAGEKGLAGIDALTEGRREWEGGSWIISL